MRQNKADSEDGNDEDKLPLNRILGKEVIADIRGLLRHGFGEVRLTIHGGVLKDSEVTKRRRHNLN